MGSDSDDERDLGELGGNLREEEAAPELITYKRRRIPKPNPEAGKSARKMGPNTSGVQPVRDKFNDHWNRWRDTLESWLQLPEIREGGGIQSCIQNALDQDPLQLAPSQSAKTQQYAEEDQCEVKGQSGSLDCSVADISTMATGKRPIWDTNTALCNNVLLDILMSEKFALLCDLLSRIFDENKFNKVLDIMAIDSKMRSGQYARSPRSFNRDMQQMWGKVEEVGREMTHLASTLSVISQTSYKKKAGSAFETDSLEHKTKDLCLVDAVQINPRDSTTTIQLTCDSGHSTKPDRPEASRSYKSSTCKRCGEEAYVQKSLICDGCEAIYHFDCIEPCLKEIPTESWHCSACSGIPDSQIAEFHHHSSLHGSCALCQNAEFIEISVPAELIKAATVSDTVMAVDDSPESSYSSPEAADKPDLAMTARSRLCKICGTCEDDDRKFLVCGHPYCRFKYYHIRCMRTTQIASKQQADSHCWYCPSCLCRACYVDKDDDSIVLCDGCDDAYHTYCMVPPQMTVPKGLWYCAFCNSARAKQGMRKFEQSVRQQLPKRRHRSMSSSGPVKMEE